MTTADVWSVEDAIRGLWEDKKGWFSECTHCDYMMCVDPGDRDHPQEWFCRCDGAFNCPCIRKQIETLP